MSAYGKMVVYEFLWECIISLFFRLYKFLFCTAFELFAISWHFKKRIMGFKVLFNWIHYEISFWLYFVINCSEINFV